MQMGFPIVVRAHQEHEKPEDVADWILGEIAPNYYEHLAELTYDRITAVNPGYAQLDRQWLESVLTRIREEASGGEGEHAETG